MSRYDSIIGLPHPAPAKRAPMSMHDRAAQFAPFAALTGFGAEITEAARLTEEKIELDEHGKALLDEKLRRLRARMAERPEATITYFVPDERKSGGAYVTVTGRIKKIDPLEQTVTLEEGTILPMADIYAIQDLSSADDPGTGL